MTELEILDILKDCDLDQLTAETCEKQFIYNLPDLNDYFIGATKVVLDFPHTDFVIKIPFSGFYLFDPNEYVPFQRAEDNANNDDYCAAEVLRYSEAKREGLEFLFAETALLGYVNGHPIYKQNKCTCFCDLNYTSKQDSISKDLVNTALSVCDTDERNCFNPYWLAEVLQSYGFKILTRLLDFLRDMDINDLHDGNIGYFNGQPVLIDYASFYDYD